MKTIKNALAAALIITVALTMILSLTSCKRNEEENEPALSIKGEKNVEISLGESVTLTADVSPADTRIVWTVTETNLYGEYTLDNGVFTAKQCAGYAIIKANGSNGCSDYITVVINRDLTADDGNQVKAVFYATDGNTVIDVRYPEDDGSITFPDYAVGDAQIIWLDENGNEVDPSNVKITANCYFTAKAVEDAVYYTVRFWYYGSDGTAVQVGDDLRLNLTAGETVSSEARESIEAEAESALGKEIINWRCEISSDGFSADWYAETTE